MLESLDGVKVRVVEMVGWPRSQIGDSRDEDSRVIRLRMDVGSDADQGAHCLERSSDSEIRM